MEHVQVINLKKIYRSGDISVEALKGISFTVNKGEFISVVGTSGSGKSTLLNLLGCLDVPTGGGIWIDGNSIKDMTEEERTLFRRRQIGFVFQQYNLVPILTVFENIVLPLQLDQAEIDQAFLEDIVESLEIGDLLTRLPKELSGGQQQRVAIARALITKPALVLADEPTGNLDSVTGRKVMSLFQNCARQFHQTMIMVTHQDELAVMADRVLRVEDGKLYETTGK